MACLCNTILTSHRIFRYVKDRDKQSPWATYTKFTDDVDTQWKLVMNDCGVKVIYALSPQAKGKIERSYQWLQDHIVRSCVRQGITSIEDGRTVLNQEVEVYNGRRVHATTGEIPDVRFKRAIEEEKSMFRAFTLQSPFESVKDVFCLRMHRVVDAYRRISINHCILTVPHVLPRQTVELRLYPDLKTETVEVRFWYKNRFVGCQNVVLKELPIVRF